MADSKPYIPISCEFHDDLEAFATLRRRVRIFLQPDSGEAVETEGIISDIFTSAEKEEFLRMENGALFRLDRIRAVLPESAPS